MGDPAETPLILVIDDDEAVLQVYQDLLEDDGYRLSVHSYPPADPEEVRRLRPNLILLDLLFGEEDLGWDFLRMIKTEASTARVPVVVATANQRFVDRYRSQFDDWNCPVVLKPFDIEDLSASLRQALLDAEDSGGDSTPRRR
ncbi:MAG TPA: response regulator [Thermomicrobiales bacterium]|jgi:CheY-like chemotaxis protein